MRIVQLVTARQYRGAEMFAAQLSRALVAKGVEVLYVSLYRSGGKEFIPEGLDWVDMDGSKARFFSLSLIRKLNKLFVTFHPDLVQANAGDTLKYAVLTRAVFGLKYKVVFRNASMVSAYLRNPFKRLMQGLLLRQMDRVISVSDASKEDILALYPFLGNKIETIPIAVDTEGATTATAVEINEGWDHPVFIHVGGFTFEKNHEGLIRIFESFRFHYATGSLLLVGDGLLKSRIERLVNQKSMAAVKFLGSRDDIPALLKCADVLVLPSLIEGLPAVILEAFANRIPVVAYDVGGISEVLINGRTGWLVTPGDEEAFVEAMKAAMDSEMKENVVNAAYQSVVEKYSLRRVAERFLSAYSTH